jgi:hypothetical protein
LDDWGFPNQRLPDRNKSPNEVRVFVLGDSTMWGSDRDITTTIPALTEDELRRRGLANISIYNFSIVSSVSMQMLALLFFRLTDYNPDLVLIVCGGSDIFIPCSFDPRPGYPYNFYVIEELYTKYFDFDRIAELHPDFGYSALFHDISARQAELRNQVGFGQTPQWELAIIESFGHFLTKLDRVGVAYGLDVAVLLEPLINTKTPLTDEESRICRPETFAYYQRQYNRYQNLLFPDGQKPKRWGDSVTVHDATDVFDGQPRQIYTDFIHYNTVGKTLMVQRIVNIVLQHLELPRTD